MEKSTSKTFLYHSTTESGTYTKLVDITSYPDLFSPPEKLDVSDLSSNQKKYTPGMVDLPDYEFGFNYTKAAYDALKDLEDGSTHYYQLRFGEKGEYGAWQWSGTHFALPVGGQVGSKREGKIICYPDGEVTEATITNS